MFGAGLACNYIIYDCNVQRLLFINSNGKCRIWGKIPCKVWTSTFTTLNRSLGNHCLFCRLAIHILCKAIRTIICFQRSRLHSQLKEFKENESIFIEDLNQHWQVLVGSGCHVQIQLHYVTEYGEHKHNLLLTAGWWVPILLHLSAPWSLAWNLLFLGLSDPCNWFAWVSLGIITGGVLLDIFTIPQKLVLPSAGPYLFSSNMCVSQHLSPFLQTEFDSKHLDQLSILIFLVPTNADVRRSSFTRWMDNFNAMNLSPFNPTVSHFWLSQQILIWERFSFTRWMDIFTAMNLPPFHHLHTEANHINSICLNS